MALPWWVTEFYGEDGQPIYATHDGKLLQRTSDGSFVLNTGQSDGEGNPIFAPYNGPEVSTPAAPVSNFVPVEQVSYNSAANIGGDSGTYSTAGINPGDRTVYGGEAPLVNQNGQVGYDLSSLQSYQQSPSPAGLENDSLYGGLFSDGGIGKLALEGAAGYGALTGLTSLAGMSDIAGSAGGEAIGGAGADTLGEFAMPPSVADPNLVTPALSTHAENLMPLAGATSQLPSAGLAFAAPLSAGIGGAIAAGAGTGVGTAASGVTPLATSAATGTALSRLLEGAATSADKLSLAGILGQTALGVYGANQQSNALSDLVEADSARADRNFGIGAPSRARYEGSFAPGFDITSDPALRSAMDSTTDTLLRRLSTQGNPYGNPGGLAEAEKYVMGNVALPYLQNYRTQNANTGGYSSFNTATNPNTSLSTAQIGADNNMLNAIGFGAENVFNPKTSLADLLKQFGSKGGLA